MRGYLVVDSNRERAYEFIRQLNQPKEIDSYVEHKEEAIIFYDDKKYFIANQVPKLISVLSLHGVYLHGEMQLNQKEEEGIRNSMIKTYGLDGVDPDLPHVHRY